MSDGGVGRAIFENGSPPSSPVSVFSAKEEPIRDRLAIELSALGIKDLRIASSTGERKLYSRDQSEIPGFLKTIMFHSSPDLVVQPRTREAVAAVLKFASSKGITAIPRGSGSSPFGGSVPVAGGIIVDISGMDRIVEIDAVRSTARVQAGVRWADLDHELGKRGLGLNTSPSSKFSTVGGWIATGGMGLNSFSRGHLKYSVHAMEIVTADGAVRELTRLDPEFETVFGSEGQLGIVTEVTISVRSFPVKSRPHLVCFDKLESALSFASALGTSAVHPSHIVFESSSKFTIIDDMLGKAYFQPKDSILVNIEGENEERAFESFMKTAGLQEEKEYLARYMWNERYFPMKVRKLGPGMLGSEVVIPQRLLPEAIAKTSSLCKKFGLVPLFEVHFLKSESSLFLCYYLTDQGSLWTYTMDALKSMIVTSNLVNIGARPYSIGVWNYPFSDAQDREKVQALLHAKQAMDPNGVMNSGKFFSLSGRARGLPSRFFSPGLMRPLLKAMITFSPLTSRAIRVIHSIQRSAVAKPTPKTMKDLVEIADECAMCGACVSVCPAYMAVRDERVTGRGKLLTVKSMARGERISKEHSDRTFLCTKCKACEQVCQSKLALVAAYEVLEKELERTHGIDRDEIARFTKYVESSPEYDALIEKGLVIGAPRHGMGGGTDV